MADLTGFRQMLADRASSEKGLPEVCLKCSTDFDMMLSKLITVDNRGDDETDAQVASRYVDEICAELAKPENAEIAEQIGSVIQAFKEKITSSTSSLNEIRNTARELAGYMEQFKTDALARDPFVSTHLNLTKLSEDYPTWEWAGPKLIGGATYIKERVGAMIVAKDVTIPTEWNYKLFLLAAQNIKSKISFKEGIELADDAKTTLIDQIVETLGETVSKDTVTEVMEVLVGNNPLRGVLCDLANLTHMNPADLFTRIKDYDGMIQKYYPIADCVENGQVKLPDGVEGIAENAAQLKTLCEFLAYFELMERDTVFRQSILLQGGLMNVDEKAAYEEAGGTNLMIAHYIRYMYKDDVAKIPAHGISSKVIIESAAHNEKVVKSDMSNITNRIAIATTAARVAAFNTVAHRYITNKVDREAPDETLAGKSVLVARLTEHVVKKIASRIHHHDIAFTDAALMLIIEADYSGTFVEQMYNELGAAYLAKAQCAEDGKVSDLDLQVAEMGVISTMVSNFIVNNLIEVCPIKDNTNKAAVVPQETQTQVA